MTLPQLTEKIRNNQFDPGRDLFTASISLPAGEVRDFLKTLAGCWIPGQDRALLDQKEELENDPDFIGGIIHTNTGMVADALEDEGWMHSVIENLSRLDQMKIKNYIIGLEDAPSKKKVKLRPKKK